MLCSMNRLQRLIRSWSGVLKVIRNLADDGMTMMIVTHEMGLPLKSPIGCCFLPMAALKSREHRRNCSISRKARGCSIFVVVE